MSVAEGIVFVFLTYGLAGLVFAVYFALSGVARVDDAAKGSGFGFRLLIIPASAALWPLLLARVLSGRKVPVETNAHRQAARREDDGK